MSWHNLLIVAYENAPMVPSRYPATLLKAQSGQWTLIHSARGKSIKSKAKLMEAKTISDVGGLLLLKLFSS